ncbi:nucleotidyltransferase domain-containing protein [Metallumcola ferriviriculae]|uniref:Nucleotidyltransferase domain-containing protein n=1 Tax=Metallumcola ferriviriculae TaxID=3039180 RepID=A0AAU0UQN4_9FIRM|nr:nucleotidyltransferase domain-containing protein [Desulfitibacteraceae bacterium MK1]
MTLDKLVKYFAHNGDDIIAAYLFGSHAVGVARDDSDIDIGVLLGKFPDSPTDYRIEKAMELEKILGKQVDFVIINQAPFILQFQIFKEGKIIYEKDADKRATYQMHFLSRYYDFKRFYDFHSRYLINEIKERGLGVGYSSNRRKAPQAK